MSDALEEHGGKVGIGGRTSLWFTEQELEALVEILNKTCSRYKMEISDDKTKQ